MSGWYIYKVLYRKISNFIINFEFVIGVNFIVIKIYLNVKIMFNYLNSLEINLVKIIK